MESQPTILTINAGSSSIKFALFGVGDKPERIVDGVIERIGLEGTKIIIDDERDGSVTHRIEAADHEDATRILLDWVKHRTVGNSLQAVGHRVVHGGPYFHDPERVTLELLEKLRDLIIFDPLHLPSEIKLIEMIAELYPGLAQVVCFDTAFHHDLPEVARMLPIPRKYQDKGIRRYGFHGLSYQYLLDEIKQSYGEERAQGRLVLAHLGSGASLAAVHGGKSVDTSMGLTPAGGIMMSTRTGDMDPGLMAYLARSEKMDAQKFDQMINNASGLLGVSETSADMKVLLEQEQSDPRAQQAADQFCYQVKKTIGAYAAAMGGIDTLVFTGGMGENAPKVRERVCAGLEFLGVSIDSNSNYQNAKEISADDVEVQVLVIHTDEAMTIAKSVSKLMQHNQLGDHN